MITVVGSIAYDASCEWFWRELRALHDCWDPLAHEFHLSLSAGALDWVDLRTYAEAYDHLVVTLAAVSNNAAGKAPEPLADLLRAEADAESAQLILWRAVSRATGWAPQSARHDACDPCSATLDCVRTWEGSPDRSLALDLVTLHAAATLQAETTAANLWALQRRYGFGDGDGDGAGTEHFRSQAEIDSRHAGLARWALEGLLASEDPFPLLEQAGAVNRSYWHVLDQIQEGGR